MKYLLAAVLVAATSAHAQSVDNVARGLATKALTSGLLYSKDVNGAPLFVEAPSTPFKEGVCLGPRACSTLVANGATNGYSITAIGADALANLAYSVTEDVAVGGYSQQFVIGASGGEGGNTSLGQHSIGFDPHPNNTTDIGNDSCRDCIGQNFTTLVGERTGEDGIFDTNTVVGSQTLEGSAGLIVITGTVSQTDNITVSFTSTNSLIAGLPGSAATVAAANGETLATLSTKLATSINNFGLFVYQQTSVGSGVSASPGTNLNVYTGTQAGYLRFHFPGGQSVGWAITPHVTCTVGPCLETFTVYDAFSGDHNVIVGSQSWNGNGLTQAQFNVTLGDYIMQTATGATPQQASRNVMIGQAIAQNGTTDYDNVYIGYNAAQNVAGSNYNVAVGYLAGYGLASSQTLETILGPQPQADNCITTGNQNTEIGADACVPSSTTAGQLSLDNFVYGTGLTGRNTTVSPGRIGIGTKAPNAALTIGTAGGGNDDGHLGFLPSTFISASSLTCGTSPTVDPTASDGGMTITPGSGATTCTIPFLVNYQTLPHITFGSYAAGTVPYIVSKSVSSVTVGFASVGKFDMQVSQ